MRFTIIGTVWENGTQRATFDLADGIELGSELDASRLLSSYVCSLIIGGGTATYSRPHDEYKIIRADGVTEYVKWPRAIVTTGGGS